MILTPRFCSNCGEPAHGNFCSSCGHRIALEAVEKVEPETLTGSWDDEVRYETLLRHREVRDLIKRYADSAVKGPTGEQILSIAEKIIPMGISTEKLLAVVVPIYKKMGIQMGRERQGMIAAPVGRVIVRALCSLAKHGQTIRQVHQADDGCQIDAVLPSDLWALEGDLYVTVQRQGTMTHVAARTHLAGQYLDWGKSTRRLERLFKEIQVDPS